MLELLFLNLDSIQYMKEPLNGMKVVLHIHSNQIMARQKRMQVQMDPQSLLIQIQADHQTSNQRIILKLFRQPDQSEHMVLMQMVKLLPLAIKCHLMSL